MEKIIAAYLLTVALGALVWALLYAYRNGVDELAEHTRTTPYRAFGSFNSLLGILLYILVLID